MSENGQVRIPGFTIERELGRGAMGVVYLAHEDALGRDVALKVLREGYGGRDEDARQRFEREVRATARIKHPNIVPILSTGESDGRLWFAMQFVPGETLEDVLEHTRHGRIGTARAVRIVREVALALHAAHESGVTHRDVKPGNVMLLEEEAPESERGTTTRRLRRSWIGNRASVEGPRVDKPLLADFGLAADRTATKLSESGMLIGTPGYMAPEQYTGLAEDVGPHSDQWAVGVMLYECLTGTMPFPTGDLPTLARMIGNEDPIPPSRLDTRVDRDLETICLKCLEKNPKDRYADCRDLAKDLSHWLREEPIQARPPGSIRKLATWSRRHPARTTALAALIVVGLGALGVWWGIQANRKDRVASLSKEANEYMAIGRYQQAERIYDEWITVDPADGRPRDLRERARALREMETARGILTSAEAEIAELAKQRSTLQQLVEQSLHGKDAAGGKGLGTENALGSEPWWMREASYSARRKMAALQESIAASIATVSARLANARSLASAHADAAGETGQLLRDEIVDRAGTWHLEEWRRAVAARDAAAMATHRAAVEQLLDRPEVAKELSGVRRVRILPALPAGEAWLFRYERESDVLPRGGPRLLPLPYHPERERVAIAQTYKDAVARHLDGEGRRRVAPDVQAPSRPLRDTERRVGTLAGPMLRTRYEERLAQSAYPLETSPRNSLGRIETPLEIDLVPGRYLLLLRRAGRPDLRVSFEVGRDDVPPVRMGDDMELLHVPDGFVLVPGGEVLLGSDDEDAPRALPRQRVPVRPFLAARFEVTYADWWAFLNDARTLAMIETRRNPTEAGPDEEPTRPELRFVPRTSEVPASPLPQGPPESRFWRPMDGPEHPVSNINLFDLTGYLTPPEGESEPFDYQFDELADALRNSDTVGWGYLRWRTERSRARAKQAAEGGELLPDVAVMRGPDGNPMYCALRFTLPTQPEWERMARGGDGRRFAYGDEREWLHFKGPRSRPWNPAPEPVGLFDDDESVYGVRDLSGSVSEWTADWDGEGGVFWIKGGAWVNPVPELDRIAARRALPPATVGSAVGVRLIVRILEPVEAR